MNELLFSEVDWGAHDSRFFLFQINIDHDAMTKEYFLPGLWGELQQSISSVRELDLAMCVSPSLNGSKMRSLWTNQMKS